MTGGVGTIFKSYSPNCLSSQRNMASHLQMWLFDGLYKSRRSEQVSILETRAHHMLDHVLITPDFHQSS